MHFTYISYIIILFNYLIFFFFHVLVLLFLRLSFQSFFICLDMLLAVLNETRTNISLSAVGPVSGSVGGLRAGLAARSLGFPAARSGGVGAGRGQGERARQADRSSHDFKLRVDTDSLSPLFA